MKPQLPKVEAGSVFKLWEYRVSHSQLLIRCPKVSDNSTNVDLAFYNVEYIDLPSTFSDLEIDEPTQEEIQFASSRLGKPVEGERIVVLTSQDRRHIVVAGALLVSQSRMGVFESPFTLPSAIFPGRR